MKTITLQEAQTIKNSHRSREGVADKLEAFLNKNVSSMKKDCAYVIEAKDFLSNETKTFHYYTALKMLQAKFANKITWDFTLLEKAQTSEVRIIVK